MQKFSDYVYTEEIKMENKVEVPLPADVTHLAILIIFIFALPPYLSLLHRSVVRLK